ncbi:MAG: MXAN_5187 C-terminal domain-containing protein [Desulfuromonadaceae bacterium]
MPQTDLILYEQYFSGVEKREPAKLRTAMEKRLRRFINRKIIQTDLRFRYQSLAARFFSYSSHWDRILRLMDEGRYVRQRVRTLSSGPEENLPPSDPRDQIYQDLLTARTNCNLSGEPPEREKVYRFLETQQEKIRQTFGEREVEFRVVIEDCKPKIKVRAKKA